MHRYHWTPRKLHRTGLRPTGLCWRCTAQEGTYLHMVWDCRLIKQFWTEVCQCVSKITGTPLEPDPAVFLLGILSRLMNQSNNKCLAIAITVAKKLLFCQWKNTSAPNIQDWFNVLTKIAKLERVIYCNTNSVDKYEKMWCSFISAMVWAIVTWIWIGSNVALSMKCGLCQGRPHCVYLGFTSLA